MDLNAQMTRIISKKAIYKNAFTISWVVVCIVIFMFYTARFSVVHGALIEGISVFAQKLADIQPFIYLGKIIISFLEIVLYSSACVLCGIWPASKLIDFDDFNLKQSSTTILVAIGSSFLFGHWLFSTTFLFLSIYKLFTPSNITLTLIVGCISGIYPAYKAFIETRKNASLIYHPIEKTYRTIYLLAFILLFTSLTYSTSRLSYDSVAIYFSDAKIIALTNRFQFFQGNSFLLSSLQTGIQFSAIIQLFGDQTARMFSWVSGCVILIFGFGIAEKIGISSRAKGIFLTLILTSTAFTDLLGDGKVDLTSSAIAVASIFWLLHDLKKTHLLLAGFFAGLAMVSRPYNIFLLSVFIGVMYLIKIYNNKKTRKEYGLLSITTSIFWIVLGSIIPLTTHFAANWLVYGSPLATLTDVQNMTTGNWQWAFDPKYIWLMKSLYPFVVTFLNTPQSIGSISPVFIAFLPFLLFSKIRNKVILSSLFIELLTATLITLFLWIVLFFTTMEIRYIFFIWVLLFIFLSDVIVTIFENIDIRLQKVFSALLVMLLVFSNLRTIYFAVVSYSPVDTQGNPQCTDFIFCDYLKPINDNANPGERVLSLLAYRYYLRADLFSCSTDMDEYHALRNASLDSSDAFWKEVYRQGYTYIAYEKNYSVRHLFMTFVPSPSNTPDWMNLEPIYGAAGDNVVAYRINVLQSPMQASKTCIKNEHGIWEVLEANPNQ